MLTLQLLKIAKMSDGKLVRTFRGRCSPVTHHYLVEQPAHLYGLMFVAPLVLRVEREELEHQEVEHAGDEGEAEHDEDEHEGDVLGRALQRPVLLQRHVVAEPDGGQRREAVVDGVQVAPLCSARRKVSLKANQ